MQIQTMEIVINGTEIRIRDERKQKMIMSIAFDELWEGTEPKKKKTKAGHRDMKPESAMKKWSKEEDQKLIEMKKSGMTSRKIGKELGRSQMAIGNRYYWLCKNK